MDRRDFIKKATMAAAGARRGVGDCSDWSQGRPHVYQLRRVSTERR